MIFTDLIFLFGFLPLAMLIYWPFRNRPANNLVLLLISLFFYGWGSLKNLFVLLLVLLWNYISAMAIARSVQHKKGQLVLGIAGNLLILLVYKYLNPALIALESFGLPVHLSSLIMPVGLSFYMFSCLSYVLDVYMEKAPVQTSFVKLGVFAAFFGRVNMGPIAHYARTLPQLEHHPFDQKLFMHGGPLFLQGLFMKVLLADNLAMLFSGLAGNTSWLGNLLHGFAYFFQLYMDFSGYSRMARGLGCFFGFEIPKNFNKPYEALSVQDFWRRWHISLTTWFTQYIYIPLGGNRVSSGRWIFNIMVVWLLTGIWHGSSLTFVVWGIFQGCLLIAEKKLYGPLLEKAPHIVRHTYVVITQLLGWTLFFSSTLSAALQVIGRYFGVGISGFADSQALFYLANYALVLVISLLVSTSLPKRAASLSRQRIPSVWKDARILTYAVLMILCIACLVSATNQTFLYAAF